MYLHCPAGSLCKTVNFVQSHSSVLILSCEHFAVYYFIILFFHFSWWQIKQVWSCVFFMFKKYLQYLLPAFFRGYFQFVYLGFLKVQYIPIFISMQWLKYVSNAFPSLYLCNLSLYFWWATYSLASTSKTFRWLTNRNDMYLSLEYYIVTAHWIRSEINYKILCSYLNEATVPILYNYVPVYMRTQNISSYPSVQS